MNLSPPLARQLFARHDLSAEDETMNSNEKAHNSSLENVSID
jgi:hypothetical protein